MSRSEQIGWTLAGGHRPAAARRGRVVVSARTLDLPAARWRRTLTEHQAVNGRCPICGTPRRCREWGEAFGQLVAHDLLLPPGPSPINDRPHPTAG